MIKQQLDYFILYEISTGNIKRLQSFEFDSVPAGHASASIGKDKPNIRTQNYNAETQQIVDKSDIASIVNDQQKLLIRFKRNARLISTDWTQMSDVDLTTEQKEAWQTYRQELRDFMATLPAIIDASYVPTWPVPPSQ